MEFALNNGSLVSSFKIHIEQIYILTACNFIDKFTNCQLTKVKSGSTSLYS